MKNGRQYQQTRDFADDLLEAIEEIKVVKQEVVWNCRVTGKPYHPSEGVTISAIGLGRMVEEGFFRAELGGYMPHNFAFTQMSGALSVGPSPFRYGNRRVSAEGADQLLREYGRIRGWIAAAAGLPAVRKVIERTQSPCGMGSPRTTLGLEGVWKKYPSPGNFERRLWAVKARAKEILSAYEGQHPSWNHIAQALLMERRVGKAAIVAVALTLGMESARKYCQSRDWLVERRSAAFPAADTSDGVEVLTTTEPSRKKLGSEVRSALQVGEYGQRKLIYLVRRGERTFHQEKWGGMSEVEALRHALVAWRRQDELLAEATLRHGDLVGFLKGEGVYNSAPLFTREDSYRAGNCQPGTESFAHQQGWANREFVRGIDFIPFLDDERVRRVVVGRMVVS